MSANAANVQLSYAEGELPAQTSPAPAPAAAPSTPPAPSSQETSGSPAKSQPTPEPAVAGPPTAEPAAPEMPRFSATGSQLLVTAGTQTPKREDAGEAAFPAIEEVSEKEEASSESTEKVDSESELELLLAPSGSMFLDHLRTLPVVRCSSDLYARAKSNGLLSMPLAVLECTATLAAVPVKMAALPFQAFCPTSLFLLDWTLYKGLDAVLAVCPCFAAPLNQVCSETKKCCVKYVCCCPRAIGKTVNSLCPKTKSA